MHPQVIFESTSAKIVIYYLMIGWATQLPGGLFRRYPAWWLVRQSYELQSPRALLGIPVIWIPFTILLWPVPFLRAGIKLIPVAAGVLGLVAALVLIYWTSTVWGALVVVAVAGLVPTYFLRPRM